MQDVLSSELARINTHAPAPAPELSLLAQAATAQPESVPAAGRVDPVSAPVLAALVPVAGQLRPTVNESVQTVSSAVPSIVSAVKEAGHDISSIFTGRKLLEQVGNLRKSVWTIEPIAALHNARHCASYLALG